MGSSCRGTDLNGNRDVDCDWAEGFSWLIKAINITSGLVLCWLVAVVSAEIAWVQQSFNYPEYTAQKFTVYPFYIYPNMQNENNH